jgi:hypothetical protein
LATKELAVTSQQRTVSHFLLYQGIFYHKNITVVRTHATSLKGRRFDTSVVMEAELQAVLNILQEHDFQDAVKTW